MDAPYLLDAAAKAPTSCGAMRSAITAAALLLLP
jgi:hypothetical protein